MSSQSKLNFSSVTPIAQRTVILNKTPQTIQIESVFVQKMTEVNLHPLCLKPGYTLASHCCIKTHKPYASRACHAHKFFSHQLAVLKSLYYSTESRPVYRSKCLSIKGWSSQPRNPRLCISNSFLYRQAEIFLLVKTKKKNQKGTKTSF